VKSIVIDAGTLDNLYNGNVVLDEVRDASLGRNGTELLLSDPKVTIDSSKLIKEIRKLAILRQPMFEVYFKVSENYQEWNFQGAFVVKPPEIQGHRIPVDLDDARISGEIVIARRPLSEDERGIAIMVGSHIVTRSNFGFDTKLNRVSGYVRCDSLTSRFADKSALIEDAEYSRFNDIMKSFVNSTVLPGLSQYEDVLITREESRIYKEIDKVLGQALVESTETHEEIQELTTVDVTGLTESNKSDIYQGSPTELDHLDTEPVIRDNSRTSFEQSTTDIARHNLTGPLNRSALRDEDENNNAPPSNAPGGATIVPSSSNQAAVYGVETSDNRGSVNLGEVSLKTRKFRTPVVKRTFALKKVGYKVIPYEDGSDSRYSFTSENVVFVNKANSTYKAEASRGDEFLLRHIINMVAEAVAQAKHPEGKEALELQNRLIGEAIRIHDGSTVKK
jgi:hypothetical protein